MGIMTVRATGRLHIPVMRGVAASGFVMVITDFRGKTQGHRRITVMAAQTPLGPTTGPHFHAVRILESNLALPVSTHFVTR